MRKPRRHKPTGSVIQGESDLAAILTALLDEADGLHLYPGDRAIVADARDCEWEDGRCPKCGERLARMLADIQEILSNYAEPYCYFGVDPGDGSSFGWWINNDAIQDALRDGDIVQLEVHNNGETVLRGDFDQQPLYRLIINDHGNRTLQHRSNGRVIWEVV